MKFSLYCFAAFFLCACGESSNQGSEIPAPIGGGFPVDGVDGKTDVFGRSLVGAPNPYVVDPTAISSRQNLETRLTTNMKARRDFGWDVMRRVLEPVPLLGLQRQADRLRDCPDGVISADLDKCSKNNTEGACTSAVSGGVGGVCFWENNTCSASCDLITLDGKPIPKIPRWQTWYGMEDISAIFKLAYGSLDEDEQSEQKRFSDQIIGEAFSANNLAIDRSRRWPLRRYTQSVNDLLGCDLTKGADESEEEFDARCAISRQSGFSGSAAAGGGVARLMYSPAMVLHMMRNYGETVSCSSDKLTDTWCEGNECSDPVENFSTCFREEFPTDAGNPWTGLADAALDNPAAGGTVLVKATWARVGFDFGLAAYDTDAEALERRLKPGANALWTLKGDRQFTEAFPEEDEIYTISTKTGAKYRLTGLHVITKEIRHWVWVTMWWSDKPDTDFGADRPDSFNELPGVWKNYKMCVVVDYTELDADPLSRFENLPSLQEALRTSGSAQGAPTWCSNPYIEREVGNARTNCIGCHQHAGTAFKPDGVSNFDVAEIIEDEGSSGNLFPLNGRLRTRKTFATDYSWAFSRLDNLTEIMRSEINFKGTQNPEWVRIRNIVDGDGDVTKGEELFKSTSAEASCVDCHGESGEGGLGPDLNQVFNQKTNWNLAHTLVNGRGRMPEWGATLSDDELTDIFSYLKLTFDTVD